MSGSEGEIEIAEILRERKSSRRGLEYLVRWKDFGASNDSWEPLKNLVNAAKAIAAFHAKTLSQKKKTSRRSATRSRSRSRSRGRSGSRSPARGKKKTTPSRKSSNSLKSSSAKTTTTTTTTTSPTKEEISTETVITSPGRFEKTTETLARSILTPSTTQLSTLAPAVTQHSTLTPAATQRSTHITRTAEVRTTTSNDSAKLARPSGKRWLQSCCTPVQKMKKCCAGFINSDYPAVVVFGTITVIVLSFILERNVDLEKLWSTIVAFLAGIWAWLSQLVSK